MDLRDKLRKAAGLFVELPPEEPAEREPPPEPADPEAAGADLDQRLAAMNQTIRQFDGQPAPGRTVEQIVRQAEGPDLDQIKVPASAPPPVAAPDGKVDFSAIYGQANLPATPFTAEQTLDMLSSLPQELPLETKRLTVKVTLGAMGKSIGATPETIVADASRKLAALAAYTESVSKQTTEFVSAAELEVAALQAQIEEVRRSIQASQQKQAQALQMCSAESDRLDDVLEFFSLDVPPSKHAVPDGQAAPQRP